MKELIENFESLSEEDVSRFAGEWIAIVDSKVVFHSNSFEELYIYVKKNYPNKRPLIGKLPPKNPIMLGAY